MGKKKKALCLINTSKDVRPYSNPGSTNYDHINIFQMTKNKYSEDTSVGENIEK